MSKEEDAVFELVFCGGSWKVSGPRCLLNIAFLLKANREPQFVVLSFHFNV